MASFGGSESALNPKATPTFSNPEVRNDIPLRSEETKSFCTLKSAPSDPPKRMDNEPKFEMQKSKSPSEDAIARMKKYEEIIRIKEEKENQSLKLIEDPFVRTFLTVQYNLANDINRAYYDFLDIEAKEDKRDQQKGLIINNLKADLNLISTDCSKDKIGAAEALEVTGNAYETKERLLNYWETAQLSESSSTKDISLKLGQSNLFREDINYIHEKWSKIGEWADRFINIIQSVTGN